eukprot:8766980-Lingulodinium_polyedra.AAC.1
MGLRLDYPPDLMWAGVWVHRAQRVVKTAFGASAPIRPWCSILAGCTQSTSWARCTLHDILAEAHAAFMPRVRIDGH